MSTMVAHKTTRLAHITHLHSKPMCVAVQNIKPSGLRADVKLRTCVKLNLIVVNHITMLCLDVMQRLGGSVQKRSLTVVYVAEVQATVVIGMPFGHQLM